MKGNLSRVNLVKHEALLKDLHATSVLSFPNANENVFFNSHIYAKAMKTPKKSKNDFIGKYLPQFSYASLQTNAILECTYFRV